jgi:hypothetical protein
LADKILKQNQFSEKLDFSHSLGQKLPLFIDQKVVTIRVLGETG